MLTKGGSPVSFVEFQNAAQASYAMNMLQGFVLCPDRGGIRIEFAKTKMVDNGKLQFPRNVRMFFSYSPSSLCRFADSCSRGYL